MEIGANMMAIRCQIGDSKFDVICTKYMRDNLPSHSRFFFFLPTLQIIWDHLVLLLSSKVVVLPVRITFKLPIKKTFKRLTLLKLTFSCFKNVVVWNNYVINRAY